MAEGAPFEPLAALIASVQAGAGGAVTAGDRGGEPPASPGGAAPIMFAVVLGEGGGAPGWARALSNVAARTEWIVPDADDARRLGEMLAQHAARAGQAAGFALSVDPGTARAADMLIVPDSEQAQALAAVVEPLLAPGAVVIAAGDRAALLALSDRLARPERLVGVHLPPPASVSDLAEILPGPATAPAALAAALALAQRMQRLPVALPTGVDCPSLSLTGRLWEEVEALLLLGTTPWELDEALHAAGWAPPGPCLRQDLAGIDLACALRARHARLSGRAVLPVVPRMLAEGRLGQRGGVGWYRYPGGGGPVIDPLMEDMCAEEAHFAGLERRAVGDGEVLARLTLALIDEAAALALQGDPALPDLVAVRALGFPPALGGPLGLAARLGMPALTDALAALAASCPDPWAGMPARLTTALARRSSCIGNGR